MAGYLSQAIGAAFAGFFITISVDSFSASKEAAIHNIVRMYALIGALMFVGYFLMDRKEMEAHEVK